MTQHARLGVVVVCLLLGSGARATAQGMPGNELSADWLTAAQEQIRASEYELHWYGGPGIAGELPGYVAPNRANGLWLACGAHRVTLSPHSASDSPWQWSFELAGWHLDGEPYRTAAPSFELEGDVLRYRVGTLQQLLVNDEHGVHLELVLSAPPATEHHTRFVVELHTQGDLQAYHAWGGGLDLREGDETMLRLEPVSARDGDGNAMTTRLGMPRAGNLEITVEIGGAAFPISIKTTLRGPGSDADWSRRGGWDYANFGFSVATAGDVNGDGYSDVVVGLPGFGISGRAEVFHGSASGLNAAPNWQAAGEVGGDNFGHSVAMAGNVNDDIYADIIVGSPFWDGDGGSDHGKVYVYCGSASGVGEFPCWTFEGIGAGDNTGAVVATAGDVNGDGFSDVLVNAPNYDLSPENVDEGAVFYFEGSESGLPPAGMSGSLVGPSGELHFGSAMATAGDVNGDGFADIIVGSPYADSHGTIESGLARIFWGTAGGPVSLGSAVLIDDLDVEGANFGYTVATAGDVNGDGYSDVLVAAPGYAETASFTQGKVHLYLGGNPFSADPIADWTASGGNIVSGKFGFSAATAGDVNADGYSDILIGDYSWQSAYLWLGSAAGLGAAGTVANADWSKESTFQAYGFSVATAGDVNGDGYSDLIIGAPEATNPINTEGVAEVFHGGPDKPSSSPLWSDSGGVADAAMGFAVASAGDVNGDGFADLILGAPNYYNGNIEEGAIFVWHGGEAGPIGWSSADFTAYGGGASLHFGASVASAGDLNGDGYDDIIVGAPGWESGPAHEDEGGAFVWFGSMNGVSGGGSAATASWRAESDNPGAELGWSASSAGDVNGDGYADIVVGARKYHNPQTQEGAVFVWHGSALGLGAAGTPANADWSFEPNVDNVGMGYAVAPAGDTNGDGYGDLIASSIGSGLTGTFVWFGSASGLPATAWSWFVAGNGATLFGNSVASAGDVNGDGYGDIVIGEPLFSGTTYVSEGRVHGYCGGPVGFAGCFDERGNQASAGLGWSVAGAGDVNGDGFADVLAGAPFYDVAPGGDHGEVRLYYGSSGGPISLSGGDWVAAGTSNSSHLGYSVASAGDVNGDGFADIIAGAPDAADGGEARLFPGNSSFDTGWGVALIPRQMRAWGSGAPIAHGGMSNDENAFDIQATPHSAAGRAKVTLLTEVKPFRSAFDGFNAHWGATVDTGTGSSAQNIHMALTRAEAYHWRARFYLQPASNPFMPRYSRWFRQPWGGAEERDIYTAGRDSLLFEDGFESGGTSNWSSTQP